METAPLLMTEKDCQEFINSKLSLNEKRWIVAVIQELQSARKKHPWWPDDVVHRVAIISEETGELVQAALQNTYENAMWQNMHHEAIQVASTCLRFLDETNYEERDFLEAVRQRNCDHIYEVTGEGHNKKFYTCRRCNHQTHD